MWVAFKHVCLLLLLEINNTVVWICSGLTSHNTHHRFHEHEAHHFPKYRAVYKLCCAKSKTLRMCETCVIDCIRDRKIIPLANSSNRGGSGISANNPEQYLELYFAVDYFGGGDDCECKYCKEWRAHMQALKEDEDDGFEGRWLRTPHAAAASSSSTAASASSTAAASSQHSISPVAIANRNILAASAASTQKVEDKIEEKVGGGDVDKLSFAVPLTVNEDSGDEWMMLLNDSPVPSKKAKIGEKVGDKVEEEV